MKMADRDALWSTFLGHGYAVGGAIARLLRWVESLPSGDQPAHTVIMLAATALTWFLTSSNRLLRDRTTKTLVKLLSTRLRAVVELVDCFSDVDDGYVLERLAAVAYGSAMRSQQTDDVVSLATTCYERFFKDGFPPANALSRDYLRGVVERGLHLKPAISADPGRIRPPYRTPMPNWFDPDQSSYPDLIWESAEKLPQGLRSVHRSVTADDFKISVLSSLHDHFLAAKLTAVVPPTRREIFETFRSGLNAAQKAAWGKYRGPQPTIAQLIARRSHRGNTAKGSAIDVSKARARFEATLTDEQRKVFRRDVRPYVEEGSPAQTRRHIAPEAIQHFILEHVNRVGWSQDLDEFDKSSILSSGRSEHKVERIGKKYQWLAFYELIGLLADNFYFTDRSYDTVELYEGPWQLGYCRNIDPSLLLRSKPNASRDEVCWWAPKPYASWSEELDELAWLKSDAGVPSDAASISLVVKDPRGSEWVVLDGQYGWRQPTPSGREDLESPQRDFHYRINSCLVRVDRAETFLKWLLGQDLRGLRLLEPRTLNDPFLGEMYWAAAYLSQLTPYYGYDGWTGESLPDPALVTTEYYYAEPGSFDGSMDRSIRLACPSPWIVQKMGLRWNGVEGEWCGGNPCRVMFRDPSARASGPGVLLASQEHLNQFLQEEGCALIWVVTGSKWVAGGRFTHKAVGRRWLSGAILMNGDTFSGEIRSSLEIYRHH
jgi:hypothetical protein